MTLPLNVPSHLIKEIAIEQAASRASSTAASMAHRSPSAIPALEFEEIVSKEDQTTSERLRSLHPAIEFQMNSQPDISSQPKASPGVSTGRMTIAVPLYGHQRDQHQTTAAAIEESKHQELLSRLRDILIHPDLANPEALTESTVDSAQQVEWDIQCSAKFRWLKELLQYIQPSSSPRRLHIAISIEPGNRDLLLQRFLLAMDVPFRHAGSSQVEDDQFRLSIVTDAAQLQLLRDLDCLVSLDNSYAKLQTDHLQALPLHIRLIVPYSIEHIDASASPQERADAHLLQDAVRILYRQAGRLDELPDISTSAQLCAVLLTHRNSEQPSDLVELPPLDLVSLSAANGGHQYPSKRSLDDSDEDTTSNKRIKSEDISLPQYNQPDQVQSLLQRLETALSDEQDRRSELETNIGDLQYRYESMSSVLADVTRERDAAIKTAQQAVTRMNQQIENIGTLKTSMSQLRDKLAECETNLASHTIPERAEIETLRQTATRAIQNEEKATAKLDNIKKDLTYAQTLYQDASTKAQALARENDSLTKQLAIAEAAASTERGALRQMSHNSLVKNLDRENKQLRTSLALRESALVAKDDEIARMRENRGRMATRGSSVPRSPRMNSPLKMDTQLGSSRHGSPHPLRNC